MTSMFTLPLDVGSRDFGMNVEPPKAPTSSYWKVPDQQQYLTSLTLNHADGLCAVASGAQENNLFIYEMATNTGTPKVTHHQTISLPYIHSMQWVPTYTGLGSTSNLLVSGHRSGLMYMTMLPETYSSEPAEIQVRYNHMHHVNSQSTTTRIKQLELVIDGASLEFIGSICADNMFLWRPDRWDVPVVKIKQRGINCFDASSKRISIAAFGGRKGVSIADFRNPGKTLSPPVGNSAAVTHTRWSPTDENMVAAVDVNNTIKIWDIRNLAPLSTYESHHDVVTGVEWSSPSTLVSASHDGTVRVWDWHDHVGNKPQPTEKWAQSDAWRSFQDRHAGMFSLDELDRPASVVSQSNKQIFGLKLYNGDALTIDSSGCFGHHKINQCPPSPTTSADDSSDNDFNPPSPNLFPL